MSFGNQLERKIINSVLINITSFLSIMSKYPGICSHCCAVGAQIYLPVSLKLTLDFVTNCFKKVSNYSFSFAAPFSEWNYLPNTIYSAEKII